MTTSTVSLDPEQLPEEFTLELNAQDRCDACGARAYARFHLKEGALLFCAHHSRQHGESLREKAVYVHDETDTLSS